MKNRIIALLLALVMLMTLSACEGKQEEPTVETDTAESAQVQQPIDPYEIGRNYLYGLNGTERDLEAAYNNFNQSLELGNADASFYLGVLCDWYAYPEQDFEQARAYYEACGDNPNAEIALGFLYKSGKGVDMDDERAKALFETALGQGSIDANLGLGEVASLYGDSEAALQYYTRALDGTEQLYIASAMERIGEIYEIGSAVEQNYSAAIEWFEKAAYLGNEEAMVNLGWMYSNGEGIEQDGAKAVEWYGKAADLGAVNAMMRIGWMYHHGYGVEQNYAKALEWYEKAENLGDENARVSADNMRQLLN